MAAVVAIVLSLARLRLHCFAAARNLAWCPLYRPAPVRSTARFAYKHVRQNGLEKKTAIGCFLFPATCGLPFLFTLAVNGRRENEMDCVDSFSVEL